MSAQTEIGQLFLMPKDNKHIPHNELSIHNFADGFSFCTQSKIEFIPHQGLDHFKNTFKEFFDFYPEGTFEKLSYVTFDTPSSLVPETFWDVDSAIDFAAPLGEKRADQSIGFDHLKQGGMVNLYYFKKPFTDFLGLQRIPLSQFHYHSRIFEHVYAYQGDGLPKRLFIHLQKKGFDVFYFDKNALQIHNRFEIKTVDEFLYYLFFLVEQYELKPEDFSLFFMGRFAAFEAFYEAVENYHSNILFLPFESALNLHLGVHPAPYFATIST